jgi:streptomycin 6-kinase
VVDVPDVVRNKAIAHGAASWLDALPALLDDLAREWSLTLGPSLPGGTEAYVVTATRADDGTPCVLKLGIPRIGDHIANEATALRLADGNGCARLLRADVARSALLLERLGPSLFDVRVPIRRRHEILCSTAARVWRRAPDAGLPTGAVKGRWLAAFIVEKWEELDHPCSERAVEYALTCAERRVAAHDDERARLVHGDVHQWNALRTVDDEHLFKLVDPDGLLAEPEYDLGIIMREDPVELLQDDPHERARFLASRTGLDADAIWEWGVVERVSTGLLAVEIDLQPVGGQMLTTADAVASRASA